MRTLSMILAMSLPVFLAAPTPSHAEFNQSPADFLETKALLFQVSMTDQDQFAPALLTIHAGDSVEWTNRDDEAHTVTADPAKATNRSHFSLPPGVSAFDSGDIGPGKTFTKLFTVPGTYVYFCTPHQDHGMIGTIQVLP